MSPHADDSGVIFLTMGDVLEIQKEQIELYGGGPVGVLREELLDSAVQAPRATFDGQLLYEFPFGMAAVYMVHIIKNHPLLNANKRTGSMSAVEFLKMNGYGFEIPTPKLRELALRAEAGVEKAKIAKSLRTHYIAVKRH